MTFTVEQALIVCGGFCPITASAHAAPAARVILSLVDKVKDARSVLATPDERVIAITQEVSRPFCNWNEQVGRFIQLQAELLFESPFKWGYLKRCLAP